MCFILFVPFTFCLHRTGCGCLALAVLRRKDGRTYAACCMRPLHALWKTGTDRMNTAFVLCALLAFCRALLPSHAMRCMGFMDFGQAACGAARHYTWFARAHARGLGNRRARTGGTGKPAEQTRRQRLPFTHVPVDMRIADMQHCTVAEPPPTNLPGGQGRV